MARVTVEDCIKQVPNRFELVVLAAQRARDISSGDPLTLTPDNDKNPVIALREIAAENLDMDFLRNQQIKRLQKNDKVDEINDENLYAEAQDGTTLEADYADLDNNSFSIDEESELDLDLDSDMDFSDNINEEEKD